MNKLLKIPNLDVHPSNVCNLNCEQCSHLSNYNNTEIFDVGSIEEWYKSWHLRLLPDYFSISGGEPLTNPNIEEILLLTKKYWKHSKLRFFTNGLLSKKFEKVASTLKKLNYEVYVSNHSSENSNTYDKKFEEAIEKLKWCSEKYDLKITIQSSTEKSYVINGYFNYSENKQRLKNESDWVRWYKGYGRTMEPYNDNNPEKSFDNCVAPCPQLYENKIYRCAPIAYLPLIDKKVGLSAEWDFYLNYKPLNSDCTDPELLDFFDKTLGPEKYCNMCPSNPNNFTPEHDPLKFIPIKQV